MSPILRVIKRLGQNLLIAALGFVAGVFGLYVWWVQGGPPLQPWHQAELAEEYRAGRTEIATLADYLALEDRLFAELDEKVYAQTPTGRENRLVRFSPGSASDPRDREPNWNRTFELVPDPSSDPSAGARAGGVLLLHGMSDGPYSLRALGEALAARGYRVLGLRMPGHGTAPAGLLGVTWEDMAGVTRLGMAHLDRALAGRPVHIIGYSTGAALALDYTLEARAGRTGPLPASLVLVSPAVGITPLAAVTPWFDRLGRLPGLEQVAWTNILPEFDPFNYNSFSANASVQVHRMTRSITARVSALSSAGPIQGFPHVLLLLSAVDATVSPAAAVDHLLAHLAPEGHELLLYDINRYAVKSPLLVSDPGPLIQRLLAEPSLPFDLTLIENESPESRFAVARTKDAGAEGAVRVEPLGVPWPDEAVSLAHVDLPFPPDDPLYGRYPPAETGQIFLGQLAIRGERGVLKIPAHWLLRLRHNPFYDYQERRVLEWIERANSGDPDAVGFRDGGR